MNSSKIRTGILAAAILTTGAFGLAGCAGDTAPSGDSSQTQSTEVDVAEDLQTARQAVLDALADNPDWAQVMLAGDVTQPTQKYGLLVMPFVKSDAADHITGTVEISDGKFVIEAESAETGQTWQIDQDGTITEVAE